MEPSTVPLPPTAALPRKPGLDVTPPTPQPIAVRQAPAELSKPTTSSLAEERVASTEPKPQHAHALEGTKAAHGPHRPIGIIVMTVVTMIILSAVAVAIYLSSGQ